MSGKDKACREAFEQFWNTPIPELTGNFIDAQSLSNMGKLVAWEAWQAAWNRRAPEWVSVDERLPDGDCETIYIGINDAGFVGAFTSLTATPSRTIPGKEYLNCYYDTAEEEVHVMNGLKWWRKLDLPAAPQPDGREG